MGLYSLILRRDALIARLLVVGFIQVPGDGWMLLFLDPFGSPTEMVFVPLGSPSPTNEADFEDCLKQAEDVCTLVEGQRLPRPHGETTVYDDAHWHAHGTSLLAIHCPAVPPSKDPGPFRSIPGE